MQIPRGLGEIAGWGLGLWLVYHILKEPSLEDQCWEMARVTAMPDDDPLGRDPEDKQLRLQEIERNVNLEAVEDSRDLVKGCIYDACYFTRPKWTPDTIAKVVAYVPRDRGCEQRGRVEQGIDDPAPLLEPQSGTLTR